MGISTTLRSALIMEHPFMPDISDKTVDELQTSMNDLTKKLTFAHRMGQSFMINQIQMVLEGYKTEYAKRMDELYKKQNIQNNIQITK
jgi:methionyl-tRNA synthetase